MSSTKPPEFLTAYDQTLEDNLRVWMREWELWCQEIDAHYSKGYIPTSIFLQREKFRVWVSRHKNIIILDMHR